MARRACCITLACIPAVCLYANSDVRTRHLALLVEAQDVLKEHRQAIMTKRQQLEKVQQDLQMSLTKDPSLSASTYSEPRPRTSKPVQTNALVVSGPLQNAYKFIPPSQTPASIPPPSFEDSLEDASRLAVVALPEVDQEVEAQDHSEVEMEVLKAVEAASSMGQALHKSFMRSLAIEEGLRQEEVAAVATLSRINSEVLKDLYAYSELAELERLAAEQERIAAEKKAEAERLAAEAERLAAEARAAALKKAADQRRAAEDAAEQARIAAEREAATKREREAAFALGGFFLRPLAIREREKRAEELRRQELAAAVRAMQHANSRVDPKEILSASIDRLDTEMTVLKSQTQLTPHAMKKRQLSLSAQRKASQGVLFKLQLQDAISTVDNSMKEFQHGVYDHASQWSGMGDVEQALANALNEFIKADIEKVHALPTYDESAKKEKTRMIEAVKVRAKEMVDELHGRVMHMDRAVQTQLTDMYKVISDLQKAAEGATNRQHLSQVLLEASALQKDMLHLSERVDSAMRVVGWVEYDLDDAQGRFEYVGQMLPGAGDEDVADGMGCMQWLDGCSFAGQLHRNLPHGCGEERFADGSLYIGEFSNGERNGHGVFQTNNQRWSGIWENGEMLSSSDQEANERSRRQMADVMRNASRVAALARALVPHIQGKTSALLGQEESARQESRRLAPEIEGAGAVEASRRGADVAGETWQPPTSGDAEGLVQ